MKYVINVPDIDRYLLPAETRGSVIGIPMSVDNNKCIIATNIEYIGPYTEPDRKAIEDAQNQGWKFANDIINGLNIDERRECFGYGLLPDILKKCSYQEAKEKYEVWKKQKEAIHVGDEVKSKETEWGGVVTNVDQNGDLIIMDNSGETGRYYKAKHFEKTGRHFTEIEELLKKMKEESK